jgi:hypothetical protein
MVTVYVWPPKGDNVGHAAVKIEQTYISWWPEGGIVIDPKGKEIQLTAAPVRGRTYIADVKGEGGPPEHKIHISGLNESAMVQWWAGFGLQSGRTKLAGPLPKYHLLKQSCSTVAARALQAGGGNNYSGWWNANKLVWTPMDVYRYANEIARNRAAKGTGK